MARNALEGDRILRQSPYITKFRDQKHGFGGSIPTPKERLKRACLERARQKRREQLQQRRNRYNDDYDNREEVLSAVAPARMVIDEELERQGVVIYSSCMNEVGDASVAHGHTTSDINMEQTADQVNSSQKISDSDNAFITEDELIELLQDVDDELRREDEFLDEACEAQQAEEMRLQAEIEEFERWQDQGISGGNAVGSYVGDSSNSHEADARVLCPLCCSEDLEVNYQRNEIICPCDGCNLRLKATVPTHQSLNTLRDILGSAHYEHAKICSQIMQFEIQSQSNNQNALLACCDFCRLRYRIC